MSSARHLRVVDTETGEIHENPDPSETIKALEAALVRAQSTITGLKAKYANDRATYAKRSLVEDIIDDWKVATGHPKSKRTDDRFDAVKNYLEKGYTREHFEMVLAGLKAYPYVVYGVRRASGSKSDRKDDIAYVCEKGRRFEDLAVLGHELKKAEAA